MREEPIRNTGSELNETENLPTSEVVDKVLDAKPHMANDPSLLLVRGSGGENKPYIKTLAHAVLTVVSKYGYASLKCVGASAINNAMKAIVIASGDAKKRGVNLVIGPSFQEAEFQFDGETVKKTAIMLSVFDR